jgi:hypothetical protein
MHEQPLNLVCKSAIMSFVFVRLRRPSWYVMDKKYLCCHLLSRCQGLEPNFEALIHHQNTQLYV